MNLVSLAAFLRARRASLRLEDVSLPDYGDQRRVAGLRREEVAQLAGVSVDYYTRIEQGRVSNPSGPVLDALARALRLSEDETRHLHRLSRQPPAGHWSAVGGKQRVRPMLRILLDDMPDVPAVVMGRRMDILAWNSAACALIGDLARLDPAGRNIARITFLDETAPLVFADWAACARENVAYLQMEAGRYPKDRRLADLIEELSARSADFRRWWTESPVQEKTAGTKYFHHPVAGDLELGYETLRATDDPDQALIMHAAAPGSSSHEALQMLLSRTVAGHGDHRVSHFPRPLI